MGASSLQLRSATTQDVLDCGRVCYRAFSAVAERHAFPRDFAEVGAALDLISQLVANPRFFSVVAERDGTVVGSNFLDQRASIFSVGPVTVEPDVQDHGIGGALMAAVLDESARRQARGVRLVQVAYNTRSLSLYARLGFDVREPLAVLQGPAIARARPGFDIRPATREDVPACDALCVGVHGHDRSGELREAVDRGAASVVTQHGRITAYSTGIGFTGYSVAETDEALTALIAAAPHFAGPGFLMPLRNTALLRWCLGHGLRVVYVANLMTVGYYREPRGAYLASIGY